MNQEQYRECMKPYLSFCAGAKIIGLYQRGLSAPQIGLLLGVSRTTIIRRLKKWAIPIRLQYPSWNKGLTVLTDERVRQNSEKSSRMKGHKHTEETKQYMSQSRKGMNIWSKGRQLLIDHKLKIGEASRKLWQNPEYRAKVTQKLKELWADPIFANRVRQAMVKGYKKPNRLEQRILNIISKFHLPFKYTGDGSLIIHGFNPDFVNCNGAKVVIEVFGDYWHGKAARTWKETELGRIMAFNSFGFRCIVLWEKELKTLPDEAIMKRIKNETRRV